MEQLQSHIWLTASSYVEKYLRISSYLFDFATAPLWISLNMTKKIIFFFISVVPSHGDETEGCRGQRGRKPSYIGRSGLSVHCHLLAKTVIANTNCTLLCTAVHSLYNTVQTVMRAIPFSMLGKSHWPSLTNSSQLNRVRGKFSYKKNRKIVFLYKTCQN